VEPGAFGSFVRRLDLVVDNGKIVKDLYTLDEMGKRVKCVTINWQIPG
jgi:hypothetical protein